MDVCVICLTGSAAGQMGVAGPGMTRKLINGKTGRHECNNLADAVTKARKGC